MALYPPFPSHAWDVGTQQPDQLVIRTELPPGLELYARTPDFTAQTLPHEFLTGYATEEDVWGQLRVIDGGLICRFAAPVATLVVTAGETIVIEPRTLVRVEFVSEGRFFLEFHLPTAVVRSRIPTGMC